MKKLTVHEVLDKTNWKLLAKQKLQLLAVLYKDPRTKPLEGLLNWIDAIQDAAENEGYPVVFLEEA